MDKTTGLVKEALDTDEHGGFVEVFAKKGHESKMSIGVDNHGDSVAVQGYKRKAETVIGITQYGNGAVNTWEKNGNRQ